ncbi:MAG TPA: hypothetical protein VFB80_07575 [Pirellulaceae bacterium]|nr:hypothetical protein [Pirellulaceae bacterium]
MSTRTSAEQTATSESAPARRRGAWWRFSIRELLLLTAAVAAFLAWAGLLYQRSLPYQRTTIPDTIGNFQDVRTICAKIGHRPASYSSGGGGSSNMYATIRSYDCQVDLPAKLRGQFMADYREHIRATLAKLADRVGGAGSISDGRGLQGFSYEYAEGRVHGTVVVRSSSRDDGLSLFIFVHEYDSRR